jgi:hypothetical protein
MDEELRSEFKRRDDRHEDLVRRVEGIENVQGELREDIAEMKEEGAKRDLTIQHNYMDLKMSVSEVLPKAIDAAPQWMMEREKISREKTVTRYTVVAAVAAVIGVICGLLTPIVIELLKSSGHG